ncbi:glucose-6-phosphate dehydrogenase assembly protein OpcA [Streptomyces sp. AM 4-1-1]|uniref:glucose-6-phosphate dehydrogenase assembly protein OpcA n=1 Tax=Streptomyces sp. AM 4-1-1 TaxID=3028710 RepID=UPI0023B9D791|nr:glucose-6-phosphate dehydrogenase assembly protein OpcA [Streptomyces sp. AM 4-1-1]WEH34830.1 glucose-6-phosphate dehydrogenase assembly protein OpcA [Streptomyces sp. AM 4-1-1]
MRTDLTGTTSQQIDRTLARGRRAVGAPATGLAFTLVVVTDEENARDAMKDVGTAFRDVPARTLAVLPGPETGAPRFDARVRVAGRSESVVLRLHGELARHADTVLLPLLPPDTPLLVWWPGEAPGAPAATPVGRLADRRIVDTAAHRAPRTALSHRAALHTTGDADLAWTRTAWWRATLSSLLEPPPDAGRGAGRAAVPGAPYPSARVWHAGAYDPSAELLAHWLSLRSGGPVERVGGRGTGGVTAVEVPGRPGTVTVDVGRGGGLARVRTATGATHHVAFRRPTRARLLREEAGCARADLAYVNALSVTRDSDNVEAA